MAGLVNGSQVVTIGPTSSRKIASATRGAGSLENADGRPAPAARPRSASTPTYRRRVVAFDSAGKKLPAPIWSILGHELIHAEHNAAGRNRRGLAPKDSAAYGNCEEEETIATGSGVTENNLRAEHGLPDRFATAGVTRDQ